MAAYVSIYGSDLYGEHLYSASDVLLDCTGRADVVVDAVGHAKFQRSVYLFGRADIEVDASGKASILFTVSGNAAIVIDGEYHPYIGPFWEEILDDRGPFWDRTDPGQIGWSVAAESTIPMWSRTDPGSTEWGSIKDKPNRWTRVDPNAPYPVPEKV